MLADAGDSPTLADRLLAPDAGAAEAALLRWAAAIGAVQAASAECRTRFERERRVVAVRLGACRLPPRTTSRKVPPR